MKIICIEMPTADEARNKSEIYNAIISEQREAERIKKENLCKADLPNLIQKINTEIQTACEKGLRHVEFSFDDESFSPCHDNRCKYTLKGEFNYTMAKQLTEIYKNLGFNGWIQHYYRVHDRCYRTGEVYLWW